MPFETFVHACTLSLPLPLPPPPPQKKKKAFCQIRFPCQFIEEEPHTPPHPPPPPPPPPTHTPRPFFSDLNYLPNWFSVSELFYKLTKNQNLKQTIFRGGGGGGRGSKHNVQMFYTGTSTLQGIQMCLIVLKYTLKYRRNGPDKLNL